VSVPAAKDIVISMQENNWAFGTISGKPKLELELTEF